MTFAPIYLPNFNLDTLGTIPFSSRRSGQATMETNGRMLTGGSNLEVFPGQPRARPVRADGERGEEGVCEEVR